jgi:LysM repeat protein
MNSGRSALHLIVPLAVVLLAVVVLFVVATSIVGSGSDDGGGGGDGGGGEAAKEKPEEKTYTVEPGDSLTTISEKTGVSVDKLSQLNPDLDPQALISGQQVKLR